ncbi:MAG: hypothetical protein HY720_11175 [Planctomycetes bacterium]|nr:hypothetical protein [Planctomycetota bacterium]
MEGGRRFCAFHRERSAVGACRGCSAPLCPACSLPHQGAVDCPDCYLSLAANAIVPLAGPSRAVPLVLGWVGLGLAAASLAVGAILVPAAGVSAAAVGGGLWRHLGLPEGAPAGNAILAWSLGAFGLALCALRIGLSGPGLSGFPLG